MLIHHQENIVLLSSSDITGGLFVYVCTYFYIASHICDIVSRICDTQKVGCALEPQGFEPLLPSDYFFICIWYPSNKITIEFTKDIRLLFAL